MARCSRAGPDNGSCAHMTPPHHVVLEKIDPDFVGHAEIDAIEAAFADLVDGVLSAHSGDGRAVAVATERRLHPALAPKFSRLSR